LKFDGEENRVTSRNTSNKKNRTPDAAQEKGTAAARGVTEKRRQEW